MGYGESLLAITHQSQGEQYLTKTGLTVVTALMTQIATPRAPTATSPRS